MDQRCIKLRLTRSGSSTRGSSDFQSVDGGQAKRLASSGQKWELTTVKTLTVDDQKRIRIPSARLRQVFAYVNNGYGTQPSLFQSVGLKKRHPAFAGRRAGDAITGGVMARSYRRATKQSSTKWR